MESIVNFDIFAFFQLCGDFTTILANLGECGGESSIQDVLMFCLTHDCSPMTIAANVGDSIFTIFEVLSNVANVAWNFPANTA